MARSNSRRRYRDDLARSATTQLDPHYDWATCPRCERKVRLTVKWERAKSHAPGRDELPWVLAGYCPLCDCSAHFFKLKDARTKALVRSLRMDWRGTL